MKKTTGDRYPSGRRLGLAFLVVAALVAGAIAVSGQEDEADEHPGFLAAKGRITYRVYCANCHGKDATGNGNIAQFLTVKPTDLTLLSREHGDKFPKELVLKVIDGREQVRGHGSKEMPIWGDVFQSPLSEQPAVGDESGEDRARRKIQELVAYLEAIQVGVEAEQPRAQRPVSG